MSELSCGTCITSKKHHRKHWPHRAPLPAQAWNLCHHTVTARGSVWITGLCRDAAAGVVWRGMSLKPSSEGLQEGALIPPEKWLQSPSAPGASRERKVQEGVHRASQNMHSSPGEATLLSTCLWHSSPLTSSPGRRCSGSLLSDHFCWGTGALLPKWGLKKRWLPESRTLHHRTKLSPASLDTGLGEEGPHCAWLPSLTFLLVNP